MHKIKYIFVQLILLVCLTMTGCTQATSEVSGTQVIQQPETTSSETASPIQDDELSSPEAKESENEEINPEDQEKITTALSIEDIPSFNGSTYIAINNNDPNFSESDYKAEAFEQYSELDFLDRCGAAFANIGKELMPTEERGSIGQIKPSGWHTVKYDVVDGKYLYNRCHLIGYQLTAENANEKNLITGTRFFNVEGMLPFENMVADYIKETNNHVLYRVTPIYDGDDLVARGVNMEAKSVEDNGEGICFNVFVYNQQPGVFIDYATGESYLLDESADETIAENSKEQAQVATYVLN